MVAVLPISLSIEHRFYTILLFNGNRVTKTRRNFVVIGRDHYDRIVSYINNQRKIRYKEMLLDSVNPPLACERGKQARFRRRPRPFSSMSSISSSRRSDSSKTSSRKSASYVATSSRSLVSRETQKRNFLDVLGKRTPSISSSSTSRTSTKVTSSSTSRTLTKVTSSSQASSLSENTVTPKIYTKIGNLSRGTDVLARWPDDGWYYWGRVDGRAAGTGDCYMVRDSTGFVASIADEDLLTEEQQKFQAIQPKDYVIALHPRYVYSYAPAMVKSTYTHGAHVRFYDEEACQRPWSELFQITKDKFNQCVEHIKQCEKKMTALHAIALDQSSEYYKLVQIELEAGKQHYFVPSYQSSYIKQKAIHIFPVKHMGVSSHHIPTCRYVLGPKDEQCTRYLAAEVHKHISQRTEDNQETNTSLYSLTFCDGTVRTLGSLDKCFYLSEDYYRYANSFYHHQTSQDRE
ncbi:hypothetical protein DPMN_108140 [Dreissena polymorpha]|nr:hypothetical protein DPMN_108140 [Dreissena polymorpha]